MSAYPVHSNRYNMHCDTGTDLTECPSHKALNDSSSVLMKEVNLVNDE